MTASQCIHRGRRFGASTVEITNPPPFISIFKSLIHNKLSCLLPELEFDSQIKPVNDLAVNILTDGACFLVDGLYEEPCSGFFGFLVVLDDEVLFAFQLVEVVVAALDEELSLGLIEKDLVDLICYVLVGISSCHGDLSLGRGINDSLKPRTQLKSMLSGVIGVQRIG